MIFFPVHVLASSREVWLWIDSNLLDRLRFALEGASLTATIMPLGAAGKSLRSEARRRTSRRNKENSLNQSWDNGEPLDVFEIRKLFRDGGENPQKWSQSNNAPREMQRARKTVAVLSEFFLIFHSHQCVCLCEFLFLFVGKIFERTATAVAVVSFLGQFADFKTHHGSLLALSAVRSHFPHWVSLGNSLSGSLRLSYSPISLGAWVTHFLELQFVSVVFFLWLKLK